MPRYVKGDHVVETTNAAEGVRLMGSGYERQKARTKAVKEADEAAQDAPLAEPQGQADVVKAATPKKSDKN